MNAKVERIGALGGVVMLVLAMAGIFSSGGGPALDAPAEDILTYFRDHRIQLLVSTHLMGLAMFFFLWYVASVRSRVRRAEGGHGFLSSLVMGSGAITAALLLVNEMFRHVGATLSTGANAESVRTTYLLLQGDSIAISWFSFAAFMAAISTAAFLNGAFPRWLGWPAAALAIALLVPVVNRAAFVLSLLWIAISGVFLATRTPSA